jgi:hypothetical protein
MIGKENGKIAFGGCSHLFRETPPFYRIGFILRAGRSGGNAVPARPGKQSTTELE